MVDSIRYSSSSNGTPAWSLVASGRSRLAASSVSDGFTVGFQKTFQFEASMAFADAASSGV
jgi:hypothetical protein